ncbi:MAG: hypothetical protein LBF59_07830 [Prevotellaceae bacterium]|jgi:hypothetical protein|nr:hypothetical protein [Prevotellaceae bacterium]
MGRYLDPKNNTLFRSIFRERLESSHSFFDVIMPFEEVRLKENEYIELCRIGNK